MRLIRDLLPVLRCPDDGAGLRESPRGLQCLGCEREFPVTDGDLISMVSREPASIAGASPSYIAGYLAARAEQAGGENWRIPAGGSRVHKQRQVVRVERLLDKERDLLCDFSAGPGYYTLAYAARWRRVLHCDLSLDSLAQARREARQRGIGNVLFIRMDYLKPPFRGSLPCVICLDSLIRGPGHERALLAAIRQSLSPGGAAVVDFHNWWHNPLRRLGLLRQNFGQNRSYGSRELPPLLAAAGIDRHERFPFHQELSEGHGGWLGHLLPPTRWIYRFTDGNPQ
jgi:SAM-dependent methyltransferase